MEYIMYKMLLGLTKQEIIDYFIQQQFYQNIGVVIIGGITIFMAVLWMATDYQLTKLKRGGDKNANKRMVAKK